MRGKFAFILVLLLAVFVLVSAAPPVITPPLPSLQPCILTNGGVEICDGLDNDCNNVVDDGLTAPLTLLQAGVCSGAVQLCVDGSWTTNYFAITNYESSETTCDGLNNDCDDTTDEGCACQPGNTTTCGPNDEVGECSFGVLTCEDTYIWSDICVDAVYPLNETCNGLDDNCDGSIDEDLEQVIYCGLGVCVNNFGINNCVLGDWNEISVCDPFYGATTEVCDEVDNDCDGSIDEGDVCYVPPKKSGGGGSSSSSFPLPTSTVTNTTNETEVLNDTLDGDDEDISLNKTILAAWEYVENVASLALGVSDVHFKRFRGLLPEQHFVNESSITFVDASLPLEDGFLNDNYFIFERALFDDSYKDTRFEELFVTFSLSNDWLLEHNVSSKDVKVLYKGDGSWSLADAEYVAESNVYQSRLSNAGLEELLLVADIPKPEVVEVFESDVVEVVETDIPGFSFKNGYVLFALIVIIILGAGIATFMLVKHRRHSTPSDDDSSSSSLSSSPVKQATASGANLSLEKKTLPVEKKTLVADTVAVSSLKPIQKDNSIQKDVSINKNIPINDRVIDFIHKKNSAGATIDEVKDYLRKAHWPEEHIDAHIAHYHKKRAEGGNFPITSPSSKSELPHHESFTNQHN